MPASSSRVVCFLKTGKVPSLRQFHGAGLNTCLGADVHRFPVPSWAPIKAQDMKKAVRHAGRIMEAEPMKLHKPVYFHSSAESRFNIRGWDESNTNFLFIFISYVDFLLFAISLLEHAKLDPSGMGFKAMSQHPDAWMRLPAWGQDMEDAS